MVEFLLVTCDEAGPLTHFWGDLPFRWLQPSCDLAQGAVKVTSRDNLVRYRAHHRSLEPWRWRAAESLVA